MSVRLDVSCLLLSALLVLNGIQRSHAMLARASTEPARALRGVAVIPTLVDPDTLDDAAATIVANDPFRLSNKPATARFLYMTSGAVPVVPARPPLMLRAISGGPPWSAIVEGIPGQAGGIVVVAGAAFDVIRIRSITRDTVVVQAPDTTWKLTMKASP